MSEYCWNREGVYGELNCEKLSEVIHCRNCTVYKKTAERFFKREAGDEYRKEWTEHLAQPVKKQQKDNVSIVVFRIGMEMLCISSENVVEVTDARNVHAIPHRSNEILKGIVNINGRVLLCVSVGALLGIEEDETTSRNRNEKSFKRMITAKFRSDLWVFAVDTVYEVFKVPKNIVETVPETAARLYGGYAKGIIPWQGRHIGFIDEEMLFAGLERSL